MIDVVFFVEEPSMQDFLERYVHQHYPKLRSRFVVFDGKSDLEKRLPRKLKAWLEPKPYFIVMRDQDSGDCKVIKQKLKNIVTDAGKPDALVCVVCRELESWYLGNISAVAKAFAMPELEKQNSKATYRNPDSLPNAKQLIIQLTKTTYQERSGSRAIGQHMPKENNRSKSFNYLNNKLDDLTK